MCRHAVNHINNVVRNNEIPKAPLPGTLEAQDLGCTCPILDNSYGQGYMGQPGVYVISADCPIHGIKHESNSGGIPDHP